MTSDTNKNRIVGIVKDFHFSSLKDAIEPLIITISSRSRLFAIKLQSANLQTTLARIEERWKEISPAYPFEFTFLDETFNNLYNQEKTEARLFSAFAVISILIACLGIFALASFAAEERTKEIGIRKVLGATVPNIFQLLSMDFIKLVLIGNLIAWPVAWYSMNSWLQNFAYKIDTGLWSFIIAGVIALCIAFITVSYQAIRASLTNPVETLRYE